MACDDDDSTVEAKPVTGVPITGRIVQDSAILCADPCAQPQCVTPNTCEPCGPVRSRIPVTNLGVPVMSSQFPVGCGPQLCPENSREIVIREQVSGLIKTTHATAMPECGVNINVGFNNVVDMAIGSYIWGFGYGYLKVISFNAITQEVTLQNPCTEQCGVQAAPGTVIPVCTAFIVSPPPCNGSGSSPNSLYPYLNSGFTAPAVDNCILINVTNVNGLSVSKNVSINDGVYRISAINSATTITICNDGTGLPAGTVVNYKDGAGNLIVPIVLIDNNPCLNSDATSGKILVCNGGTTQPLAGLLSGQIPVLNSDLVTVNFRTLGIPTLDCTELTVQLTLDPANPHGFSYLVIVQSTTDFTPTQSVLIGGTQFTVDTITNATQMHIIPVVDPGAVQTYAVGSTLCSASCCVTLDARLTVVETYITDNETPLGHDWLLGNANMADAAALGAPVTLTAPADATTGNVATLSITNTSDYTMGVLYNLDWEYDWDNYGGTTLFSREVVYHPQALVDATGLGALVDIYAENDTCIFNSIGGTATFNSQSRQVSYSGTFTIAPGATKVIRAAAKIVVSGGNGNHIIVTGLGAHIAALGIALPPP